MPSIEVDNGVIKVDGKVVNVSSITEAIDLIRHAVTMHNFTIKNAEKLLAYGAGLVAATNGFAQAGLPTNIREWLLGASALIVSAIHVSTPTT